MSTPATPPRTAVTGDTIGALVESGAQCLRAAGVSFEDRQDLLGHKSSRITTHYSSAELTSLVAAAEKVCDEKSHNSPATTWLRRSAGKENRAKLLSR